MVKTLESLEVGLAESLSDPEEARADKQKNAREVL